MYYNSAATLKMRNCLKNTKCGWQRWTLQLGFCVNVIAVLSKAQLLMREIEELLDGCTLAGPSNQRQRGTVRIEAGERILRQTM